jgi:hypothetical protein
MTAPEARPGGLDSNVRGLLVLAVAVVVGILLLASWGDNGGSKGDDAGSKTTTTIDTTGLETTTTGAEAVTSTTTGSTHAASEVSVIVLNGSGQTGAAKANSATIGESGYVMQTPTDGPSTQVTTVYYAPDYEADAVAVASVLGKSADVVKPLSEATLNGVGGDADVVVLLGADIPPVSSTTTSTTTG